MAYRLTKTKELDRTIELHERALKIHPPNHPHHTTALQDLAISLSERFSYSGNSSDLNRAVDLHDDALRRYSISRSDHGGNRRRALNLLIYALHDRYKTFHQVKDLDRAITLSRENVASAPLGHSSTQFGLGDGLAQLAGLLHSRFLSTNAQSDLDDFVDQLQRCADAFPPGTRSRMVAIPGLAVALTIRYEHLKDITDVNKAIDLFRQMLAYASSDQFGRSFSLRGLAYSLETRFDETGQRIDIDDAISALTRARKLYSSKDDEYTECSARLADTYERRFQKWHAISDMDMAVELAKKVVDLRPIGDKERAPSLGRYADYLRSRFTYSQSFADLEQAASALEEYASLHPEGHPSHATAVHGMASILSARYSKTQETDGIEKVLQSYSRYLRDGCPDAHNADFGTSDLVNGQSKVEFNLLNLDRSKYTSVNDRAPSPEDAYAAHYMARGALLGLKFTLSQWQTDLDDAIEAYGEAVKTCPQGHHRLSGILRSLSKLLHERYRLSNSRSDLTRCVELFEKALALQPKGSLERLESLDALADMLQTIGAIDWAINLREEAIENCPPNSCYEAHHLSQLADALSKRHRNSRQLLDLDKAIDMAEKAINIDPSDGSIAMNLAFLLTMRFENLRRLRDLDRAIDLHSLTATLYPSGHERHIEALTFQSASYHSRFTHTKNLADVDRAIGVEKEALSLVPPDSGQSLLIQERLAFFYQRRFSATNDKIDLDHAIDLYDNIVTLVTSNDSLQKSHRISYFNRAVGLHERYEHFKDPQDLDRAIWCLRQSSIDIPDISLADRYLKLGTYQLSKAVDQEDFDRALADLARGARMERSDANSRFQAAMEWAKHATRPQTRQPWSDAANAYEIAIQLLPELSWTGLDAAARLEALQKAQTLACDAAAWFLLHGGSLARAVELLEQGRAVFWTHALHVRSNFGGLPDDFSERLTSISQELLSIAATEIPVSDMTSSEILRRRQLQTDWTSTIDEIRKIQGFEHFLQPKPYEELVDAARDGPVVILVGSTFQCSALIILPDSHAPIHIPLEEINYDYVKRLGDRLSVALVGLGVTRDRSSASDQLRKVPISIREGLESYNFEMRRILLEIWERIVKPIFDELDLKKSDAQRLWWCPTGPFAFLPLHAATNGRQSTMQYVVSSYTPNLAALIAAHESSAVAVGRPKLSIICQPEVEGQASLPKAQEEALQIHKVIPSEFIVRMDGRIAYGEPAQTVIEDMQMTGVESTLDRVQEVSLIHFACHGTQDMKSPLDSALLLQDGNLTISRMQSIRRATPASLAFLSACKSAMGHRDQPDEAIHIAAALLSAGFRSTVATMWPMADEDGPVVAEAFYREMLYDGTLDPSRSALALHRAIKKLRALRVPLARWVPFVHYGA